MKVNDAAVKVLWDRFVNLEIRVKRLEQKVEFLKGQVKARLREEADARRLAD